MSNPIVVNKAQARRFLLAHQRLLPPRKLHGKQGVLDFIRHVNCIQYDPINVVGQNPHLVLQSRVSDYRPAMLDALLYEDRKLIDGFDKMISIYPVEDWPQFGYYRERMAKECMEQEETAEAAKLVKRIRDEIKARGPLSSLELEEDTRMDWWLAGSVRAARIALDILQYGGDTIVHHRVGTRRYFDLSQRVLPPELINAPRPHTTEDEYHEWHVFRRAGGLGLVLLKTTAAWGGTLSWRGGRIRATILRLAEMGRLVPVTIEGVPRHRYFVRREDLPALKAAERIHPGKPEAALIAPLDNLMWSLSPIEDLFGFHYAWEVYKRPDQRIYGYYVLPVLYGDRFVARMDPEFDRASRIFTIKNWWWEKGVDKTDQSMLEAIGACLAAFMKYLGARQIRLGRVVKPDSGLAKAISP